MADHEDYYPGEAPRAHHASHEDGGSDEISVSSLSGELTDEQDAGKIKGVPIDDSEIGDAKSLGYVSSTKKIEYKYIFAELENISPDATPTCDSYYAAGYECAKAIDETIVTRWVSSSGQPHQIELDWGPTSHHFDRIRFYSLGGSGEQFDEYYIEHWDGENWVEDVHITGFNKWQVWVSHDVNFTSTKIRFRTAGSASYSGLNELECLNWQGI